jgi:hypothetical protein
MRERALGLVPREVVLITHDVDAPLASTSTASSSAPFRGRFEAQVRYLDSCGIFKDAVLSILATVGKQETVRISERVHAGLAKARKQGRIGGRPRLSVESR